MILRLPPVTDSRIGQHASMNPLALESEHGKRIMGVRLFQDLAVVWQRATAETHFVLFAGCAGPYSRAPSLRVHLEHQTAWGPQKSCLACFQTCSRPVTQWIQVRAATK